MHTAVLDENAKLRSDVERLLAERAELQARHENLKKLYDKLLLEFERLRRHFVGPQRERVVEAQLSILDLLGAMQRLTTGDDGAAAHAESVLAQVRAATAAADDQRNANGAAEETTATEGGEAEPEKPKQPTANPRKPPKTPHGRRHTKVVDEELVIEPAERLLPGGDKLILIGEDVSVVLERRAARIVRVKVRRPKYKYPDSPLDDAARADDVTTPETAIVVAPPVMLPIEKGLAGPALIASVIVAKYADHIPLHRQESMHRRDGVHLPRSTLCGFIAGAVEVLLPIVEAMWEDARKNAPWFATDATGMLVLQKERCRHVSFFVVCAARVHVLFASVDGHASGEDVERLLAGFGNRPMISDASTVFHELQRNLNVLEVGCWAHGRRLFFDALTTDRPLALVAIGLISLLYSAHRASMDIDGVVDGPRRKELALPVLNAMDQFRDEERPRIDPDSRIAKAFNYLDNQRTALRQFLDDARLRLDNNISELELRREVIGRKNWLFCGSDSGVIWNTTSVSLIASCALHDIDASEYLRDVLTLARTWPADAMIELAPSRWPITRMREDVIALLAERSLLGRSRPVLQP